ncbi:MAG: hypothetical protein KDA87_26465, partial [Planctomycetales bacterium]|nr:hypothetical protein [Planctomycetales bacterium]
MLGTKNEIIEIIESNDDAIRNRSLDSVCRDASLDELLSHAATLDAFWRSTDNLYDRVRALFFLSAIHRYYVPLHLEAQPIDLAAPLIPFESYQHLLARRFVEAIDDLLECQATNGASDGLSSALSEAYKDLAFQTLANQVRKSVRTVRGNQWMFRTGHPADHPLRIRKELLSKSDDGTYPILRETTSVRMDFSHSGWS